MAVSIEVSADALDISVDGLDQVWGFRKRIEVPLSRVVDARVVPAAEAKADGRWRSAGLGLPGVAAVGHFRGRGAPRQWWRVYRAEQVLVVDLDPSSAFDRLVLEVDDAEAVADRINAARSEFDD